MPREYLIKKSSHYFLHLNNTQWFFSRICKLSSNVGIQKKYAKILRVGGLSIIEKKNLTKTTSFCCLIYCKKIPFSEKRVFSLKERYEMAWEMKPLLGKYVIKTDIYVQSSFEFLNGNEFVQQWVEIIELFKKTFNIFCRLGCSWCCTANKNMFTINLIFFIFKFVQPKWDVIRRQKDWRAVWPTPR